MRSFNVFEIPINYRFIVHTHSHIALLGWVYIALTALIYKTIQSPETDRTNSKIFWFTQFTLIGLLLTFPFQGYGLYSIIFSTLFLFASYSFFWFFKKHTKLDFKKSKAYKCFNAALWFMVLSSLGPWSLGIIMKTLGAESIWYRMPIYFYLHFQYNGSMILALVGLWFYILERSGLKIPDNVFKGFFWSINIGIVLSVFLSVLWTRPEATVYVLGGLGAILQGIALVYLVKVCRMHYREIRSFLSILQFNLLGVVFILLSIKMLLQLITALPYFSNLAATIMNFTIGYLHWTFLGVITIGLFLFLDYSGLLKLRKTAITIYLIGFVATELLIFYKGMAGWQNFLIFDDYFITLTLQSLFIPLTLVSMLIWGKESEDKRD